MGSTDSYTKEFMSDNNIFAEVYNFLLGRQVVAPENLSDANAEELYLSAKLPGDTDKDVEKFRDVLKKYATAKTDGRVSYVLLGIENQTAVDFSMPVRLMIYDAMRYHKQLREIAARHKKDGDLKTGEEFLSKFARTDRLKPVITVVVYYGSKQWDAPVDLFGLLDDCFDDFLPLMNNYTIKVFEAAAMSDAELRSLETSLRLVMTFIKGADDMDDLLKTIDDDEDFKQMDQLSVRVINSVTDANIRINDEEARINMCKAIKDLRMIAKAEGKVEGKAEGKIEGKIEGKAEGKIEEKRNIVLKMLKNKLPLELISDCSGLSIEEVMNIGSIAHA